jgi:hypothetical protein
LVYEDANSATASAAAANGLWTAFMTRHHTLASETAAIDCGALTLPFG